MSDIDVLKSKFATGETITEEKIHEFIEGAHNEVSDVSVFTFPHGTGLGWLNSGKVYSFWTFGPLTQPMEVYDRIQLASAEDIPPLKAYKGEPLLELVVVTMDDEILPVAFMEISNEGMFFKVMYPLELPQGSYVHFTKVLILDYDPDDYENEA